MTALETMVTSLELSKRLREAGLPQKSLYQWLWGREQGDVEADDNDSQNTWVLNRNDGQWEMFLCRATLSAYLLSELLEYLPDTINWTFSKLGTKKGPIRWVVGAEGIWGEGSNPTEACGELVLRLIKEGLVKV